MDLTVHRSRLFFDIEDAIVNPDIDITVDMNDDPCSIGNGQISATADGETDANGDYTFSWYFYDNVGMTRGALIANTSTISNLEGGFYEVEVARASTGCTISAVGELFLNDVIDPVIDGFTLVDAFDCAPPDGSITIDAMNQDTPQDYTFDLYDEDPATGAPIANLPAGSNPATFGSLAAGDYWIIATHDTRDGSPETCVSATPLQITIDDISTPPNVCYNLLP